MNLYKQSMDNIINKKYNKAVQDEQAFFFIGEIYMVWYTICERERFVNLFDNLLI